MVDIPRIRFRGTWKSTFTEFLPRRHGLGLRSYWVLPSFFYCLVAINGVPSFTGFRTERLYVNLRSCSSNWVPVTFFSFFLLVVFGGRRFVVFLFPISFRVRGARLLLFSFFLSSERRNWKVGGQVWGGGPKKASKTR